MITIQSFDSYPQLATYLQENIGRLPDRFWVSSTTHFGKKAWDVWDSVKQSKSNDTLLTVFVFKKRPKDGMFIRKNKRTGETLFMCDSGWWSHLSVGEE